MRQLTFVFTLLLTPFVFALEPDQSAENFMQRYLDGYEKYLAADERADISWVTEHFTEPFVTMPRSGPAPMATRDVFAPIIQGFIERSLSAKGVVKLQWDKLQIAELSDTQALVSGVVNTIDKNGKTIDQLASIYILTKSDKGWGVSVNLPHSIENAPVLN